MVAPWGPWQGGVEGPADGGAAVFLHGGTGASAHSQEALGRAWTRTRLILPVLTLRRKAHGPVSTAPGETS